MAGRLDFQAKFLSYGWQLPTVKRCSNLTETLGFSCEFTVGGDNSCRPFDLYSLKSASISLVIHDSYPDLVKRSEAIKKGAKDVLGIKHQFLLAPLCRRVWMPSEEEHADQTQQRNNQILVRYIVYYCVSSKQGQEELKQK